MAAGATYEPIATYTLTSAVSSQTFTSIPSTYTDLRLIMNVGGSTMGNGVSMSFNSDTATNYSDITLYGNGSTAASGKHSNSTNASITNSVGVTTNPSEVLIIVDIMNYSNTTTHKTYLSRGNGAATIANYPGTDAIVGLWRSTSAINSISVTSGANWVVGSTFTLYGIAAA